MAGVSPGSAQGVEFGAPPRPEGTFQGVPVGSPLSHAVAAEFGRDLLEVLGAGSSPAAPRALDEPDGVQLFEDAAGVLDRPALQLRASQQVQGLAEAPVQAAGCQAQAALVGERVVGARAELVGEFAQERGAEGGAGAGGARVRL